MKKISAFAALSVLVLLLIAAGTGNIYHGTFIGDGSQLTGINNTNALTPAQQAIVNSALTNTQSGAILGGTFNGGFVGTSSSGSMVLSAANSQLWFTNGASQVVVGASISSGGGTNLFIGFPSVAATHLVLDQMGSLASLISTAPLKFMGDGSGLTNGNASTFFNSGTIPLPQLPFAAVTNNSGVPITNGAGFVTTGTGAFTGLYSGLTNASGQTPLVANQTVTVSGDYSASGATALTLARQGQWTNAIVFTLTNGATLNGQILYSTNVWPGFYWSAAPSGGSAANAGVTNNTNPQIWSGQQNLTNSANILAGNGAGITNLTNSVTYGNMTYSVNTTTGVQTATNNGYPNSAVLGTNCIPVYNGQPLLGLTGTNAFLILVMGPQGTSVVPTNAISGTFNGSFTGNSANMTNGFANSITYTNFLFSPNTYTNTTTRSAFVSVNGQCSPTTTVTARFALVTSPTGATFTTNAAVGLDADTIFTTVPHGWFQVTAIVPPGGIWKLVDISGGGAVMITNSFWQTLQ